jgi:hypothetical protein
VAQGVALEFKPQYHHHHHHHSNKKPKGRIVSQVVNTKEKFLKKIRASSVDIKLIK